MRGQPGIMKSCLFWGGQVLLTHPAFFFHYATRGHWFTADTYKTFISKYKNKFIMKSELEKKPDNKCQLSEFLLSEVMLTLLATAGL